MSGQAGNSQLAIMDILRGLKEVALSPQGNVVNLAGITLE